jgi:hypothetical protein
MFDGAIKTVFFDPPPAFTSTTPEESKIKIDKQTAENF